MPRRRWGVRPLRSVDVNDPIARQEFLRLREDAVGDRFAIGSRSHQLRLVGPAETLVPTSSPAAESFWPKRIMKAI